MSTPEKKDASKVENDKVESMETVAENSADYGISAPTDLDDFYQKLQPEMRRPKPSPDAIAAALEVVQRLAAQADAEAGAVVAQEITLPADARSCSVCGYQNRGSNKFCGMCGQPVGSGETDVTKTAKFSTETEEGSLGNFLPDRVSSPSGRAAENTHAPNPETQPGAHHYHHHYHHHYFPEGREGMTPHASSAARETEKPLRPTPIVRGETMSRAEAAVRRVTQEWVLACNTKNLDDLLDLYMADAMVLRSNYPAVRGASAVREFFFGALDAGLGEVEIEPLRVDVIGDIAYEAGRCKALVPGAGKRREERGKYLWVLMRQSSGEWKLAADCWSSDLTFTGAESEAKPAAFAKPVPLRKNS